MQLPAEGQWEVAARGGLRGAAFTWGDEPERPDQRLGNYWHGEFPYLPDTGYGQTMPVGSFPANGYGLFDMAGNAWEWGPHWDGDTPPNPPRCAPARLVPAPPPRPTPPNAR